MTQSTYFKYYLKKPPLESCQQLGTEKWGGVKLWLAFVLECLGDFSSLCEVEEERFRSMDEVLESVK